MITTYPINIRAAQVESSSVSYPDTGETAWVTSTAYAVGDTVSYTIGDLIHKFYCKSAHTSASDKLPEAFPDDELNTYWIDLGAVNRYAVFQNERNTQVDTTSPYTVTVDPGDRFNMVAIGNITAADDVTLDVLDSVDVQQSTETIELVTHDVADWYSYFFVDLVQKSSALFRNLPMSSDYKYKLTFTNASGNVKVGNIISGVEQYIGGARLAAKVRRQNFSTFTRTFDGEVKITVRKNIPKNSINLHILKGQLNQIATLLDRLNGTPTAWIGMLDQNHGYFNSVFTIGLYKDIQYSLDDPNNVFATLEIEGI